MSTSIAAANLALHERRSGVYGATYTSVQFPRSAAARCADRAIARNACALPVQFVEIDLQSRLLRLHTAVEVVDSCLFI